MTQISFRATTGFTLLEVLIAIIVISIGLLGVARLQLTGMQYVTDSQFRTQASLLAQGMVDKIYANSVDLTVYQDILCNGAASCTRNGVAVGTSTCLTSECSSQELADRDVLNWASDIAVNMPSGRGWVCHGAIADAAAGTCNNAAGRDDWTVTILWDEARDGRTGQGCDPDDDSDLQCYRLKFIPTP